jgi:hypothetical protein
VKTPRTLDPSKKRRTHFAYSAFLFSPRVIQTVFSCSKVTNLEFSHSLSLQATAMRLSILTMIENLIVIFPCRRKRHGGL